MANKIMNRRRRRHYLFRRVGKLYCAWCLGIILHAQYTCTAVYMLIMYICVPIEFISCSNVIVNEKQQNIRSSAEERRYRRRSHSH